MLIRRGAEQDLNIRSAFLHLMGDVLSTVGAVIAGILIRFTGWNWLDALVMEKGSLFRKAFPQGLGSLKNIAYRLLEAWRNVRLSPQAFYALYSGRYQIRFDTS
jgi:Co/Zn/Cd efflux system component